MSIFYSAESGGFYSTDIHGDAIPKDSIEISQAAYDKLFEGQAAGKQIIANGQGVPILVEPQPSEWHEWDGEQWIISPEKSAQQKQKYQDELIKHIDDTAAEIAAHWTRFAEEYKAREEAALAYKEANFTGEPSIYISSFATVAGFDNKAATLLILQQAAGLRHLQEQLAVQRMRKYELKKPNLTIEQIQELHDDIINQMCQLAEAQQ